MRKAVFLYVAAVLMASLTLGAGCPLIPDIKDKVVELAVGASTIVDFHAEGSENVISETKTVDFGSTLDLKKIVEDAGVDADSVTSVKLSGVFYRVTRPDPEPSRNVTGTVSIQREGAPSAVTLVSGFELVNGVTSFKAASLDAAGVAMVNGMLADLLNSVKTGVPLPNPNVTYTVTGISVPASVATDFLWQMKVDVSIVGKVKVEVPS